MSAHIEYLLVHDFNWEIRMPESKLLEAPAWLKSLRQMRGEVLFEKGLRPSFLIAPHSYDDPDHTDFNSFHIVASKNKQIAGCLRLTILSPQNFLCSSAALLGLENFKKLLEKNFSSQLRIVEIGRWLTHYDFHHTMLSTHLGAAGLVLSQALNLQPFSYTGRKTLHAIKLFGARLFEVDPGPYHIEKLNDAINFLHLDANRVHPRIKKQVLVMQELLSFKIKQMFL